jgi:putative molybdopterin biosynthesis protein
MDSVFLHDIPLEEAQARLQSALEAAGMWRVLGSESVALDQALGRVTAAPVWARLSSPHYHAAAMDGYALSASQTAGASDRNPIDLMLGIQAQYVDTGDPLPGPFDCVIPIEDIEAVGEAHKGRHPSAIRIRRPLTPWTHVRPMGEDIVATELVLPAGVTLRPVDLGAIAAAGHQQVQVSRKPRVAILPTGSELIPIGNPARPGDIIEFNSVVLAAQIEAWGGIAKRFSIVGDDFEQIRQAAAQAADGQDLLLINAGSSAGSEDFTAAVVKDLGTLLAHGVAVRPGHPVILGMIRPAGRPGDNSGIPVIGVPGYPVSAALTGEIFVEPLLARWLGRPSGRPEQVTARLTRKIHSSGGDDEFLRVSVGKVGDRLIAAPLSRGAGVITSLVRADGIVIIPAGVQGAQAGEEVQVRLYRPMSEIENTIVVQGSHDLTIDMMAGQLAGAGCRLTSANVGSLGGLIALRRGEAHLAGSHLLDPDSGTYNERYIAEYLPGVPVILIALANRKQGLVVPRGNPKQITGLQPLAEGGLRFINRQRGAGTRTLLDYHLARLGISPASIQGYQDEAFTHLTVAAAIASGRADCGLGIQAAAAALDLDFIPLFEERYDLVIPDQHYHSSLLAPLLELLLDASFQAAVAALPGYDIRHMGQVMAHLG